MAAETTIGWFPVATLLVGYGVKSVSDWVQHRRTSERERVARLEARRDKLSERHSDFQRQTLLELQELLVELVRNVFTGHQVNRTTFSVTGEWQLQPLPGKFTEQNYSLMRRSAILAVRVHDETVRSMVEKLKDTSILVTDNGDQTAADAAMQQMVFQFDELNKYIGKLLRKIDDEQV